MKSNAKSDARDTYERERAAAYQDFYRKLEAVGKLMVAQAIRPVPSHDAVAGAHSSFVPPSPFERVLFRLYEHLLRAEQRWLEARGCQPSEVIARLKRKADSIFREIYGTDIGAYAHRAGFHGAKEFPEPYLPMVPVNARAYASSLWQRLEEDILKEVTSAEREDKSFPSERRGLRLRVLMVWKSY